MVKCLGRGFFLGGLEALDSRMRSVGEKGVSATGTMNMKTAPSRSDPKAWWLSRGTGAAGQDEPIEVAGDGCWFPHKLMAVVKTLKLMLGAAEAPGRFLSRRETQLCGFLQDHTHYCG